MTKAVPEPSSDASHIVRHIGAGAQRPPAQELFLPVHGYVKLHPEELAVIDHPTFQRLRRVRQLGLAHLVFPGAVHTRFEHSIGALHVANSIVESINGNARKEQAQETVSNWQLESIPADVTRLIRLGALLHDIGHLPYGHTLEDELNHLPKHDARRRLRMIGARRFAHHEVDPALQLKAPVAGWSLIDLINALYSSVVERVGLSCAPFEVLETIICKAPKTTDEEHSDWAAVFNCVSSRIPLPACRDIVGNTICADFLDYLFRDWHHLGKPLTEDKRLYEYMEMRRRADDPTQHFVINIGAPNKLRHDALTNILDLLGARYKLAETVLFHRTKLAIIGLLDRCLLEIEDLHTARLGGTANAFQMYLEEILLDASDDSVVDVLRSLAMGGQAGARSVGDQIAQEQRQLQSTLKSQPSLLEKLEVESARTVAGPSHAQKLLIDTLIDRFRDRQVYTLAFKLRMADFTPPHTPENPRLLKLIEMYRDPRARLDYLRGIESLCALPTGSLVMFCPADARMNAKIAKVKLLIDDEVIGFTEYEIRAEESGLTCGALDAQLHRFYQLWSAYVFMEPRAFASLTPGEKHSLHSALRRFFFVMDGVTDLEVARHEVEASVQVVRAATTRAARTATGEPSEVMQGAFPSGLPYRNP